jgi:hypothetical protein
LGKTSVPFAIDSESDRFKNCYPGARVDSDTPIYQLFDKELWSTFTFKERYAGWRELRRYFEHVEKVWDVKKDVEFNKHVDSAVFDEQRHQWLVECSDGTEIYCRWFILGTWSRDPAINWQPAFPGASSQPGILSRRSSEVHSTALHVIYSHGKLT